jgi:hypothetical protein
MLLFEAYNLATTLDSLMPATILDIGSGSRADREIIQPHIGAAFRGHNVQWTDMSQSPGTLYADLTDKQTLEGLPRCEMVTALSVLEHVTDIEAAIANLVSLVDRWLIVAVPYVYPEHHCPIDNFWRPSPDELSKRVNDFGLSIIQASATPPETFGGVVGAQATMVLAARHSCSER